jgi:hypothetical protein
MDRSRMNACSWEMERRDRGGVVSNGVRRDAMRCDDARGCSPAQQADDAKVATGI